jgi:hypothetical protein
MKFLDENGKTIGSEFNSFLLSGDLQHAQKA